MHIQTNSVDSLPLDSDTQVGEGYMQTDRV